MLKSILNSVPVLHVHFFFWFFFWFFTLDPFREKISASAAGLFGIALKAWAYGSHVRVLAGQTGERPTDGCRERGKWRGNSIKFMFIKIRGHHKNEKDADKSKGLSTWITIVIYLLKPGCFLSIKSHHILHLQRKASVIASHTNQHNLCNYALKVTLEAESDVSSLDSGDIADSSGDFQPCCKETSHSQTKLLTRAVYNHKHKEKMINHAEVITKQNREYEGSSAQQGHFPKYIEAKWLCCN